MDNNHDHYWTQNGILFESYKTIRGLRYRSLAETPELGDRDRVSPEKLKEIGFTILRQY